jgi:hypothetical protein
MEFFHLDLNDSQKRQHIDAVAVFDALEQAQIEEKTVRGTMLWRTQAGHRYLIRQTTTGGQTSLGGETPENVLMHERFQKRKQAVESRVASLKAALIEQQRMNRALRVGRAPAVVVDTLNALATANLQRHFLVVGTHAMIAYESAAGVRVQPAATATRDIDLLFDTRQRIRFFTQMEKLDKSLLAVLQKADKTFERQEGQLYTAVNDKGFEIDIIRRLAKDDDPHPLRMSGDENDFWAVQVRTGQALIDARRFDQVIVSTSGHMARMQTIHPLDFAKVKRTLSTMRERDPLKRSKDLLQAQIAEDLVERYLPNLG